MPNFAAPCPCCMKPLDRKFIFLSCKHAYHSECFRGFVVESTNNLWFLTTAEFKKKPVRCKACNTDVTNKEVLEIFKEPNSTLATAKYKEYKEREQRELNALQDQERKEKEARNNHAAEFIRQKEAQNVMITFSSCGHKGEKDGLKVMLRDQLFRVNQRKHLF
jgi:hypothetical protein